MGESASASNPKHLYAYMMGNGSNLAVACPTVNGNSFN